MVNTPHFDREAIVEAICDRLATGEPLTSICRSTGFPAPRTVRDWMNEDEAISAVIARAREIGFDAIAEKALEIADTPRVGVIVRYSDKEGETRTEEDMLGHRKLQVETRLKLLAKWDPKRYGELLKLGNPDGSSLELAGKVAEARARALNGE